MLPIDHACVYIHLTSSCSGCYPPATLLYHLPVVSACYLIKSSPFQHSQPLACPAPYSWLFFPFPPMVSMRSILCVTKRDCYFIIKSFFDCSLHHPHPTSPSPPPSLPHLPLPHPNGFHMKPLCAIWLFVNPHGYLSTHKVSRRRLFWMLF